MTNTLSTSTYIARNGIALPNPNPNPSPNLLPEHSDLIHSLALRPSVSRANAAFLGEIIAVVGPRDSGCSWPKIWICQITYWNIIAVCPRKIRLPLPGKVRIWQFFPPFILFFFWLRFSKLLWNYFVSCGNVVATGLQFELNFVSGPQSSLACNLRPRRVEIEHRLLLLISACVAGSPLAGLQS